MRAGAVPAPARNLTQREYYMPTQKLNRVNRQVYIANQSFVANVNGIDKAFHEGRTRAYEGDEILERCPDYFDLLDDVDNNQSYS